jgi:ABC-type nitrate/sulfonate/bicarbonate transport system permease component
MVIEKAFTRTQVLGTRIAIVAALFAAWEIAARFFVDPSFLAPPSVVFLSFGRLFAHDGVPQALLSLLVELGVAFALAILVGLVVALLVSSTEFSRRSFMPIILLLYATPQITILPIVILLTGVGPASKIVFGVTHGMFPVIVTVAASLRNVKPVLKASALSMGASRWQSFRYLLLPHMLPSFFTSMRLSMVATLLGVLLAELYASARGIGFFTRQFTDSFDPASLFALIAVIALMAIVINEVLRRAEMRVSAWRRL